MCPAPLFVEQGMHNPSAQARQLAANGRFIEGARLLEEAAAVGVGEAALELAYWRLGGQHIRRDLTLARQLFLRAAELGVQSAGPIAIAMLANGAGGSGRHWTEAIQRLEQQQTEPLTREMLDCLTAMDIDDSGMPRVATWSEVLREDPNIRLFKAFMTARECTLLIRSAEPMMQASVVVHPTSGKFIRDPVRTSDVASFPFVLENPFVHAINQRIAAATGTRVEQGEPLQVLRYAPGQQYKLHSDALRSEVNQRELTFLVYLSDDFDGGYTTFPDADLRYRGDVGDALCFSSLHPDGTINARSRHAGEPVTRGCKYLLSRWIRSKPLDLSGPPGRPL